MPKDKWKTFQETGLLWWINRTLHLFGWAIHLVVEADGSISDAYPARVQFRGFYKGDNQDGFEKLSDYLEQNSAILHEETKRIIGIERKVEDESNQ